MRSWILAVDFGTSFTTAAAREGDRAEVIEIDDDRRVPSVILVDDEGHLVVGRAAENQSAAHPGRVVREPKRLVGEPAPVVLGGRPYPVPSLVGAILEYVYERAVEYRGSPPDQVRLTHPATWRRPRLRALADAAREAGIVNVVFVPEPVAAAISYAADSAPTAGHVAIYDLGGGTFDTAVLEVRDHGFAVEGRPGGDGRLGGEFFDELLANHLGARLPPADWQALQVSEDLGWRQARAGFREEIRKAKEALSLQRHADLVVGLPTGIHRLSVTREEFESLVRPYLAEANDLLATTIADAGIQPSALAGIYLVGGASRIPLVEQLVRAAFPGVTVSRRGDPKMVVALGATHPDAVAALGPAVQAVSDPPIVSDPRETAAAALLAAAGARSTSDSSAALASGATVLAGSTAEPVSGGESAPIVPDLISASPGIVDPAIALDDRSSGAPAPTIAPARLGNVDADAPTARYPQPGRSGRRVGRPLALATIGLAAVLLAGGLALARGFGATQATATPSVGAVAELTSQPSSPGSSLAAISASSLPSPTPTASPTPKPTPTPTLPPTRNETGTPAPPPPPKDRTAPTSTSIKIAGGKSVVYDTLKVTLTLSATDPSKPIAMRVGNQKAGSCRWGAWRSFATRLANWPLATGNGGTRIVCAQYRDKAQNQSAVRKDSIYFDHRPVAVADPIYFPYKSYTAGYVDLALLDNDRDGDPGATIAYYDWSAPTWGKITGWVRCTYKGRSQYCLRYSQNGYVGPYTDAFSYKIVDNKKGVSAWSKVTVTFGSS